MNQPMWLARSIWTMTARADRGFVDFGSSCAKTSPGMICLPPCISLQLSVACEFRVNDENVLVDSSCEV